MYCLVRGALVAAVLLPLLHVHVISPLPMLRPTSPLTLRMAIPIRRSRRPMVAGTLLPIPGTHRPARTILGHRGIIRTVAAGADMEADRATEVPDMVLTRLRVVGVAVARGLIAQAVTQVTTPTVATAVCKVLRSTPCNIVETF